MTKPCGCGYCTECPVWCGDGHQTGQCHGKAWEPMKPKWEKEPSQADLAAAGDYLWLCGEELLRSDPLYGPHFRKAKDILRASRLPLLPKDNPAVRKHLDKWKAGGKTRPVLLRVREGADARPLEIADGYHRVCAAYWVDQDSEVRCFTV